MAGNRLAQQSVLSGFRPTSDLTLGNYFGAIKPALDIQGDPTKDLSVFVADMHGLTDRKPEEISPHTREVIKDCIALGIDPSQTTLYRQSDIEGQVRMIAGRIEPYISVAELARTPNLKEKMQQQIRSKSAETGGEDDSLAFVANAALLNYPVLMAADIYSQEAELVAVGQDQEPHLEHARKIAQRFNRQFASDNPPILVSPVILSLTSIRVMALDGNGKMSKSVPDQAILLTDDPAKARKKISRATTAHEGEWEEGGVLESHFAVARGLATTAEQRAEFDDLKRAHKAGKEVMGVFKRQWANVTEQKLVAFQERRATISESDIDDALKIGAEKAGKRADDVLSSMREAMGI